MIVCSKIEEYRNKIQFEYIQQNTYIEYNEGDGMFNFLYKGVWWKIEECLITEFFVGIRNILRNIKGCLVGYE